MDFVECCVLMFGVLIIEGVICVIEVWWLMVDLFNCEVDIVEMLICFVFKLYMLFLMQCVVENGEFDFVLSNFVFFVFVEVEFGVCVVLFWVWIWDDCIYGEIGLVVFINQDSLYCSLV